MDSSCLKSIHGLYIEEYEIPEIFFKGLIVDIETTSQSPENGEIIDFGIATENIVMSVALRNPENSNDLYRLLKCFLKKALDNGYRIYAYNAIFEKRWLEKKINWNGYIYDLMETPKKISDTIKGRMGNHKYPKLRELFYPRFFFVYGIRKWDIDSAEILLYWKKYVETGEERLLRWIVRHNLLDIILELEILLWKGMLDRLYENIDSAMKHIKFKCQVCGRETDPENLISITYVEPKDSGRGYQFVEKAVCKDCMSSVL